MTNHIDPRSQWHMFMPLWPVRLIDGTKVWFHPVMRRETAGGWEFRKMTIDDEDEWVKQDGW